MSGQEIQFGIKLKFDGGDAAKIRPVSDEIARIGKAANTASTELDAMLRGVHAPAAKVEQSLNVSTRSAQEMAFALRGVPAQFTDIATSLAAGQAPLTVMLQQGGQLKDMFGGAGPAAKALGGYVAGLINPLNVALAASAGLAYAWAQGDQEARNLNKSIILTGNAAGTTTGQLMAMSAGIATSTGATRGAAAEALDMLVATGKVSAESLKGAADTALNMQRATGKAVADTVAEYEQLGKTPVAAYEKLAQQYGFLSLSTRNHIKALQDQGRAQDAADLAQKSYGEAMGERAAKLKENLGYLEKSWLAVGDVAKGAWDHMLGIGRQASPEDAVRQFTKSIEEEKQTLAAALARGDSSAAGLSGEKIRRASLALAKQQGEVDKNNADAKQKGDAQELANLGLINQKTVESISLLAQRRQKMDEIAKLTNDPNKPVIAPTTEQLSKEKADAINRIRQQIAGINQELSGSRGYADYIKAQEEAAYKYQHAAIEAAGGALARRLKNNLIVYQTYYDAKRELARQDNANDITRLKNEITAEQNRGNKGTPDEKYQSKARLIALQGQLNQAEADGAKQQSAITQQETDAEKKYAADRLELTINLLESRGEYEAAYALKFSKQYGDMLAKMRIQGDQSGLQIAQGIFNFGAVKTQLERIEKAFSLSQGNLSDAEKRIQIDQQAGLLTEYEARQRLLDLRRQFIPVIDQELAKLDNVDKSFMTPEQLRRAESMRMALESIKGGASELNRTFEYGARNAIGRYLDETGNAARQTDRIFTDMFTGIEDVGANFIKTFKLDFHSLLETMGNDLAHLLSRQYVVAPLVGGVSSALGMTGAGGGGLLNMTSSANSIYGMFGSSTVGGGAASYGGGVLGAAQLGYANAAAQNAAIAGMGYADLGVATAAEGATAAAALQTTTAIEGGAAAGLGAIGPMGWAALAAMTIMSSGVLDDPGDTTRTGAFRASLGGSRAEGHGGIGSSFQDTAWFSEGEMQAALNQFSVSLATTENSLIKNLGLSAEKIATVNSALDALSGKKYGFGLEHSPVEQSAAFAQISADRAAAIAGALGMTTQQLAEEMSLSVDTLKAAYNDAILTDAEKLALKTAAVRAEFEKLGEVMPATIADYSKLVDAKAAAAAADDSIRPLYRNLLKLAPAFAEVSKSAQVALEVAQKAAQDAVASAQSTYDAAAKNLQSAYQSEIAGKQALADQMGKYVQSLRGYRDSLMLGTLGGLSPEARYAEARRQMEDVSRRAQLGDPAAIEQWQSASTAFLESSQAYNASSAAYIQDRDSVLTMTQNLESVAGRQVDLQSQQVSVLRSQLDALGAINNGVLSVAAALAAYTAARSGLAAAKGGDVSSWYAGIGRTADAAGADYWNNQVIAGRDAAAVKADFERSAVNVLTVEQLYQQFAGKTANQIDTAGMNYWTSQMASKAPLEVRRDFEASVRSLQGFADGGVASAGYYIAHENELIYSDAATRIHPAEQTSAIFDRINRPAANDSSETVLEIRRQTAAIERQNQLLEKLLSAVEDAEQSNSADVRGLKQHLAHIMSRKAA